MEQQGLLAQKSIDGILSNLCIFQHKISLVALWTQDPLVGPIVCNPALFIHSCQPVFFVRALALSFGDFCAHEDTLRRLWVDQVS